MTKNCIPRNACCPKGAVTRPSIGYQHAVRTPEKLGSRRLRFRDADPDFLIIAPCGYDMGRTMRELPLLEALPGWRELRAVKAGNVAFADGNLYLDRSGSTIVETVEIIAEILHCHIRRDKRHVGAWQPHTEAAAVRNAI
jgi:ABC-type Fe3+-citrate transport system substrate-binding protein